MLRSFQVQGDKALVQHFRNFENGSDQKRLTSADNSHIPQVSLTEMRSKPKQTTLPKANTRDLTNFSPGRVNHDILPFRSQNLKRVTQRNSHRHSPERDKTSNFSPLLQPQQKLKQSWVKPQTKVIELPDLQQVINAINSPRLHSRGDDQPTLGRVKQFLQQSNKDLKSLNIDTKLRYDDFDQIKTALTPQPWD